MNWFKKHILSHIGANNTPNASTSDVEVDKHTDLLQSNNEETQNISEKTICSDESTMSTETDSISHLKLNKQQLAAATYNGDFIRPSIFNEATDASTSFLTSSPSLKSFIEKASDLPPFSDS